MQKKKDIETALKPTTREIKEFLVSFVDKTNNFLDRIRYKVRYMYIAYIIATYILCIEPLSRVLIQRNLSRVNEPSQIRDKRQEGRTRYEPEKDGKEPSRERKTRGEARKDKDVRARNGKRGPTLFSTKIIAIYARNPLYSRVASNYNCSGARVSSPRPPSPPPSRSRLVSRPQSSPRPPRQPPLTTLVFPFFACVLVPSKPRKTAQHSANHRAGETRDPRDPRAAT